MTAQPADLAHAPGQATVYVVDDDEAVLDALTAALQAHGYRIVASPSAAAFFASFQPAVLPACLLVELDLPDLGGPELVGQLVGRRIRLPAVLMSARLRNRRLAKNLPMGVVALLEKPFETAELIERLDFALGSSAPAGRPIAPA